jgi:predicted ATPase
MPMHLNAPISSTVKTGKTDRLIGIMAFVRQSLEAALALVRKNAERYFEAEIYRLRGELLLHVVGQPGETEACFQQALAVARQQQAKSWELRAAMSLARLWQQQGKRNAAHSLLAPIYGWFTEGFDTADLQEARALLEEIGG